MSGFDARWLALREPADHRARANGGLHPRQMPMPGLGAPVDSRAVSAALLLPGERRVDRETVYRLCRWLAPRLGGRQCWTCLDHDPALLAALPHRVARWAGTQGLAAQTHAGAVRIVPGEGAEWLLRWRRADLATPALEIAVETADVVTAAALVDLVSASWLDRLVDACARRRAAVLLASV